MNHVFEKYMKKNLILKGSNINYTNTRIGDKKKNIYGGTYFIDDNDYNIFLKNQDIFYHSLFR